MNGDKIKPGTVMLLNGNITKSQQCYVVLSEFTVSDNSLYYMVLNKTTFARFSKNSLAQYDSVVATPE